MGYDVSNGTAWAILTSVLLVFAILALGSTGRVRALGMPPGWRRVLCLWPKENEHAVDYFLAARNSAGFVAIALSYFASGMGAWVVYGTTEMGATPELSWWGVLGYSSASSFPAVLICWLGPKIRQRSQDAFSTTDFGRQRYGRLMQIAIAGISVFYMFIFVVAELTSIANVYALVTDNYDTGFGVGVTVVMGVMTLAYTGVAGLPASIVTDKFQGILMACLVLVLTIASRTLNENNVTRDEWARAANWTTDGFMAAVTLVIAISCAELFNQATWQRVWAAQDVPALRQGFLLGSFLVFLLMLFFGVMGMTAYAKDPEAYDNFDKLAFLSFFDLLEPMAGGWHVVILIFTTALAASSIDSLQTGLTSIVAHDLVKLGWNPWLLTRILVVALNIPAIWLASRQFSVLELFLVADLVCATAVFPTFLGLQTQDCWGGWCPAPTELGALGGIASGMLTVLINGAVNDVNGGLWSYFWLKNNGICALCGPKTMVSFLITPTVSAIMTYVLSGIDLQIRGDRARQPTLPVAFDKEESTTTMGPEGEMQDVGVDDLEEEVVSGGGGVVEQIKEDEDYEEASA